MLISKLVSLQGGAVQPVADPRAASRNTKK
jgi:hypothetical protein